MGDLAERRLMEIRNVLVFVADSLRWDYLPDSVASQGVVLKTVAQSLFSAPSFATLATGLYPPEHGVFNWHDRMPPGTPTIFDLEGFDAGFWQAGEVAGHEIYPILQRETKTTFEDLEPPFVFLERNDDPHVPFAGTDVDSAPEYYADRGADRERIRQDYETGVEIGSTAFQRRLDRLEDRGLRDETLVIFTSDHGELLGEHGEVSHNTPACPELAYVPTVFCHPDLDRSSFAVDVDATVVEHVDVVATLLAAVAGEEFPTSGVNLLAEPRLRRWCYNHIDARRRGYPFYTAESAWWYDGGHVIRENSLPFRTAYVLYQLARSPTAPLLRSRAPSLLRTHLRSALTYGDPPIDREMAREALETFRAELESVESRRVSLDESVTDRLEQMGYR
jgi:arylsulfatase A-like enzyme